MTKTTIRTENDSTDLECRHAELNQLVMALLGDERYGQCSTRMACSVMIAAMKEGPKVDRIAALTGYECADVENIAGRMRASRLWTEDQLDYGSWSPRCQVNSKRKAVDFVMDLLVAEGMIFRTQQKRGGRYVYQSLVWEGLRPV
jgi:hypothetical protein